MTTETPGGQNEIEEAVSIRLSFVRKATFFVLALSGLFVTALLLTFFSPVKAGALGVNTTQPLNSEPTGALTAVANS